MPKKSKIKTKLRTPPVSKKGTPSSLSSKERSKTPDAEEIMTQLAGPIGQNSKKTSPIEKSSSSSSTPSSSSSSSLVSSPIPSSNPVDAPIEQETLPDKDGSSETDEPIVLQVKTRANAKRTAIARLNVDSEEEEEERETEEQEEREETRREESTEIYVASPMSGTSVRDSMEPENFVDLVDEENGEEETHPNMEEATPSVASKKSRKSPYSDDSDSEEEDEVTGAERLDQMVSDNRNTWNRLLGLAESSLSEGQGEEHKWWRVRERVYERPSGQGSVTCKFLEVTASAATTHCFRIQQKDRHPQAPEVNMFSELLYMIRKYFKDTEAFDPSEEWDYAEKPGRTLSRCCYIVSEMG